MGKVLPSVLSVPDDASVRFVHDDQVISLPQQLLSDQGGSNYRLARSGRHAEHALHSDTEPAKGAATA
jgi:hypothetical protein